MRAEVELSQDRSNRIVRSHARQFIAQQRQRDREPDFVRWIGELHPENVSHARFPDTEGIDPRIHQENSNFRVLWSEALALQHEAIPREDVAELQSELLQLQAVNRMLRFQLLGVQPPEDDLGALAVGIDHSTVDVEVAAAPLRSPPGSPGVPSALARAREARRRAKLAESPTSATMGKRTAGEASATGDLVGESSHAHERRSSIETQARAELTTSQFNATKQLQVEELRIIERDAQERRREEEARARMALEALEKRAFLTLQALEQRAVVQEQQAGASEAQGSSSHQESSGAGCAAATPEAPSENGASLGADLDASVGASDGRAPEAVPEAAPVPVPLPAPAAAVLHREASPQPAEAAP